VDVLAVSDFLRDLFLILVAAPFILLWGGAMIDLIVKHHYHGWAVVGWMLLIFVLPIIGPVIYFASRKPTDTEVDQKYLADRELQRAAARRPVGGPGLGPY
jgi:hypothetical protein